jgi:hypothetical protein
MFGGLRSRVDTLNVEEGGEHAINDFEIYSSQLPTVTHIFFSCPALPIMLVIHRVPAQAFRPDIRRHHEYVVDGIFTLVEQVAPASTGRMTPVIHLATFSFRPRKANRKEKTYLASSPARNRTAAPQSHPFPSVFNKLLSFRDALCSSDIPPPYIIGVYNIPGHTQLTLMPSEA